MFRSNTDDQIQTLATVPAAVSGYIAKTGDAGGAHRQITLQLTNLPLTITDALAYASVKLLDLPEGIVVVQGCVAKNLAVTTTSAIASTLNSGVTVQWGLGTAAASATTLATTMIALVPGTGQTVPSFTSSTTINVAATAVSGYLLANPAAYDGHTTAMPVYLNVALATGTDIDADATVTITGTIILTVALLGDY